MRIIHSRQWGKGGRNVRTTLQFIDERWRSGELNNQMARPCFGLGRSHAATVTVRSRHLNHDLKTAIGHLHGKAWLCAAPLPQRAGKAFLDPQHRFDKTVGEDPRRCAHIGCGNGEDAIKLVMIDMIGRKIGGAIRERRQTVGLAVGADLSRQ